jgi:hypothetical protein
MCFLAGINIGDREEQFNVRGQYIDDLNYLGEYKT